MRQKGQGYFRKQIFLLLAVCLFLVSHSYGGSFDEIIDSIDFYHSLDSISLTVTVQSSNFDTDGNTLMSNSARTVYYDIDKPGYLSLYKMIGPDSFEKIRSNGKEITKINGKEIKNIDKKGIKDLLPEPKIIFNLKHYLTGFDVDVRGNTASSYIIEGQVKQSRGKEQIRINVNENNEILFIEVFNSRGNLDMKLTVGSYTEINGIKIPVSIKKTIYSNNTVVEKNISYAIEEEFLSNVVYGTKQRGLTAAPPLF